MYDRGLSEDQRMMRQSCRDFVDDVVLPFIKQNWRQEWSMTPEGRLPTSILDGADKVGIRTLGVERGLPSSLGALDQRRGVHRAASRRYSSGYVTAGCAGGSARAIA